MGGTRGAPGSVRGDGRQALANLFVCSLFSRHLLDVLGTRFGLSLCIGIHGRVFAIGVGGSTRFFMVPDETLS